MSPTPQKTKNEPDATRFWLKVEKTSTCWLWRGNIQHKYGRFKAHGKTFKAHRYAFVLAGGYIPAGLIVCHKCDVPECVRPDHLFVGTHADNSRDMVEKRRQAFGVRHYKTKLTEAQVKEIRLLRSTTQLSLPQIAKRFGVSFGQIWKIVRGWSWRHV